MHKAQLTEDMHKEELTEEELVAVVGGMDMTNQPTSNNVIDCRQYPTTMGEFARWDRLYSAMWDAWP